jgi:hypothetical protein
MATFIMLPDGVTGTNNWQNYGGATADYTLVDDDTFVTSYIYETRVNGEVTFTMADPSVAEEDIDTINHVTIKLKAHYTNTTGQSPPETKTLDVQQASGIYTQPSDTHTVTNSVYPLYTGASAQYWHHTAAWTYASLGDLQVELKLTQGARRFEYLRVSYIYAEVDYDPAVAADNATFFGANF